MIDSKFPYRYGNYIVQNCIGSGSYARVYFAIHISTRYPVAIKVFDKSSISTKFNKYLFEKELEIFKFSHHPLLVELFDIIEDDSTIGLVMEYVSGGNLVQNANLREGLSPAEALHYFQELIAALNFLHSNMKVIHRDIKPDNILVDEHNNIRLIDFGFSRVFANEDQKSSSLCGTYEYLSPEQIRGDELTSSIDIWASGITLYVLLHGRLPFSSKNMSQYLQNILNTPIEFDPSLCPPLRDLLEGMLERDPQRRLSIPQIMNNSWFTSSPMDFRLFIRPEFINDEINPEILSSVSLDFREAKAIQSDIQAHQFNSKTAIYRMLNNQRIHKLLNELQFSTSRRPRFSLPSQRSPPLPTFTYRKHSNTKTSVSDFSKNSNLGLDFDIPLNAALSQNIFKGQTQKISSSNCNVLLSSTTLSIDSFAQKNSGNQFHNQSTLSHSLSKFSRVPLSYTSARVNFHGNPIMQSRLLYDKKSKAQPHHSPHHHI